MNLNEYKIILIAVGLIGILIIASPVLANIIKLPQGEQFSELYLLGPQRMLSNFPYNIAPNEDYNLYMGVGNYMGSSQYYAVYVKLLNASDLLPDKSESQVSPLYEYRFTIEDNQTLQSPVAFSVSNTLVSNNTSTIGRIDINGVDFSVNKPALWNASKSVFQYRLLFELWLFNSTLGSLQYNNRFVYLQLNFTSV